MTIDVSKLKEGDEILMKFKVTMNDHEYKQIRLYADEYHQHIYSYLTVEEKMAEITPAPFDWKDAKPGMAFIFRESGETVYYSGPDPFNKKYVICVTDSISPSAAYRMSDLSPAPEHDIEVPE